MQRSKKIYEAGTESLEKVLNNSSYEPDESQDTNFVGEVPEEEEEVPENGFMSLRSATLDPDEFHYSFWDSNSLVGDKQERLSPTERTRLRRQSWPKRSVRQTKDSRHVLKRSFMCCTGNTIALNFVIRPSISDLVDA